MEQENTQNTQNTTNRKINESAKCRIIGVTLETRPDTITADELRRMRYYGCTRIQIGIQHIDNGILKNINRGCYNEDSIRAVELLKNVGFKIDFHLMPDLPGSTPKLDEEMFYYVLNSTYLQADQWKIYPCQTTPFTVIEKWFKEKKYEPFTPEQLLNVLIKVKSHVHPWIRLNRVIRDIPNQYIIGGNVITNLRQVLETEMKIRHLNCRCIRCREVKAKDCNPKEAKMFIREYESSNGKEYFISYELSDESTIFGFVRLRLCDNTRIAKEIFPELDGCAMVRELHVYGQLRPVGNAANTSAAESPDNKNRNENKQKDDVKSSGKNEKNKNNNNNNNDKVVKGHKTQHLGFGKRLMRTAEILASIHGFDKICVIAGIGTRNYYRKIGYKLKGTYMIKNIQRLNYYKYRLIYKMNAIKVYKPYDVNCKPMQGKSLAQIRQSIIANNKRNKKKKKQGRTRNKGTMYPGPRNRNNNRNNGNGNNNDSKENENERDVNDFVGSGVLSSQKTVLKNFDTKLAKYSGIEPLTVSYYQLGYNHDAVYTLFSKLFLVMVCCFILVMLVLWQRGEFDIK